MSHYQLCQVYEKVYDINLQCEIHFRVSGIQVTWDLLHCIVAKTTLNISLNSEFNLKAFQNRKFVNNYT